METSLYSEQVRGLANHEIPGENKIFTKFNFGDAFISLAKALCETLLTLAFFFPGGGVGRGELCLPFLSHPAWNEQSPCQKKQKWSNYTLHNGCSSAAKKFPCSTWHLQFLDKIAKIALKKQTNSVRTRVSQFNQCTFLMIFWNCHTI